MHIFWIALRGIVSCRLMHWVRFTDNRLMIVSCLRHCGWKKKIILVWIGRTRWCCTQKWWTMANFCLIFGNIPNFWIIKRIFGVKFWMGTNISGIWLVIIYVFDMLTKFTKFCRCMFLRILQEKLKNGERKQDPSRNHSGFWMERKYIMISAGIFGDSLGTSKLPWEFWTFSTKNREILLYINLMHNDMLACCCWLTHNSAQNSN